MKKTFNYKNINTKITNKIFILWYCCHENAVLSLVTSAQSWKIKQNLQIIINQISQYIQFFGNYR